VAPVAQEWDPQVVNTEDLPLKACHPVWIQISSKDSKHLIQEICSVEIL
jgi:glycine cleavage system regulatory protein